VIVADQGGTPVELRVLTAESLHVAPGATLGLRMRRERLHLFDPTSEVRVSTTA
jgi:hypothetical protein